MLMIIREPVSQMIYEVVLLIREPAPRIMLMIVLKIYEVALLIRERTESVIFQPAPQIMIMLMIMIKIMIMIMIYEVAFLIMIMKMSLICGAASLIQLYINLMKNLMKGGKPSPIKKVNLTLSLLT